MWSKGNSKELVSCRTCRFGKVEFDDESHGNRTLGVSCSKNGSHFFFMSMDEPEVLRCYEPRVKKRRGNKDDDRTCLACCQEKVAYGELIDEEKMAGVVRRRTGRSWLLPVDCYPEISCHESPAGDGRKSNAE